MSGTVKKNQTAKIPTKSGNEYSYKYVDIAQIHQFLDENNLGYYQYIDRIDGDDYIMTVRIVDGKAEPTALRGARVVDATLYGNDNPAQKQGSAITYARRYSLLMAFGLATEDDDGNILNPNVSTKEPDVNDAQSWIFTFGRHKGKTYEEVLNEDAQYVKWYINNKASAYDKKCYELVSGEKLPTDAEMDERLSLQSKINELVLETQSDFDEIHDYFKVRSMQEMTTKQLHDCIRILEQKILKKVVTEEGE